MGLSVNGNEIVLSGNVGDMSGWFDEPGFDAAGVIVALAQIGSMKDVIVRLNSGGGIATEGSAIHSALARHQGKKTVVVEGIAASAASIIAMAGDEIVMSLGSIMMVHDPSGFTVGTVDDHQLQISALTALGDAMASIYAARTKRSAADCRADMKAELWMTADQAIAKGYADRAETGQPEAEVAPVAFDYRRYAHAPQRFVALADATRRPKHPASAAPKTQEGHVATITEEEAQTRIDAAIAAEKAKHTKDSAPLEGEIIPPGTAVALSGMPRAQASEIAKLCLDGNVPEMTASLLAEGATVDQAKTRIASAGEIKDLVALARTKASSIPADFAASAIAAGRSVEQVRSDLFAKIVGQTEQAQITGQHRAGVGGSDHANTDAEARAKSKANMTALLERQGLLPKKGV